MNKKLIMEQLKKDEIFQEVLERVKKVYFLDNKKEYEEVVLKESGFKNLKATDPKGKFLLSIYPFEKPKNHRIHGFCSDTAIIINIHQIEQSAKEYFDYLHSEHVLKDKAYYERESRFTLEEMKKYFVSIKSTILFVLLQTIFQQVHIFYQYEHMYPERLSMTEAIDYSKKMIGSILPLLGKINQKQSA